MVSPMGAADLVRMRILAIAGLVFGASAAEAQGQQVVSIQAAAVHQRLHGAAYRDMTPGYGAEAQLRVARGAMSLGSGVQYTLHSPRRDDPWAQVWFAGLFIEPRLVLSTGRKRVTPFVSGRIAFLEEQLDLETADGSSRGFTAGGGGGLLIRLGARVHGEIAGTLSMGRFRPFDIHYWGGGGVRGPGPSGVGTSVALRAGIGTGIW